ncbi:MAG: polysaccharide pyruvyl transferase family protein [Elusimicrobia bacterium]|nr:polysaccharide pyruvyl transferase family protein [Elusimicrobiota bacterium]
MIGVLGTGTHNRGAELMLLAICEHIRHRFPGHELAVPPGFGSREDLERYSLSTAEFFSPRIAAVLRVLLSAASRVSMRSITTVLDASGFAYSSRCAWGPGSLKQLAAGVQRFERFGINTILMPQALGPFDTPADRDNFRKIMRHSRLVFARDSESFRHVKDLGAPMDNVRLAPDFTNLVDSPRAADKSVDRRTVLIVPNLRMVDHGATPMDEYVRFLRAISDGVGRLGFKSIFLLHDPKGDSKVIERLRTADGLVRVLEATDPLELKAALGAAALVCGSRFHALVGSLSQAVPTLGMGWSHKYAELFKDYRSEDCLIEVGGRGRERLDGLLSDLLTGPGRLKRISLLEECAREQKTFARKMWAEVDAVIRERNRP